MPNLPTLHERHFPVTRAKNELGRFLIDLEKKHKLSINEMHMIVLQEMASYSASCVRQERSEGQDEDQE